MGTSTAYGGPGGDTPLIPSWLGNDPVSIKRLMILKDKYNIWFLCHYLTVVKTLQVFKKQQLV